ncbi:MAG: hypothetical protein ABI950_00640 [Solirubrobacteraceae bacterium]
MKVRLERVGLVAAMGVASVSIWTLAPLFALWVGSRVVGGSGLSMGAVFVVIAVMFAVCLALAQLLAVLGASYDRITGRRKQIRRHTPWLRAMSGDRPHETGGQGPPLSPLEYVLVGAVLLAYLAFEVWFFFYSSSPIDGRSGRG